MGVVRTIFLFLCVPITSRSAVAAENLTLRQRGGTQALTLSTASSRMCHSIDGSRYSYRRRAEQETERMLEIAGIEDFPERCALLFDGKLTRQRPCGFAVMVTSGRHFEGHTKKEGTAMKNFMTTLGDADPTIAHQ